MRVDTLKLLESYKHIVFDFDGVLSQASENKVLIPDFEYIMRAVNEDLFKYSRAPKTMQDYVEKLSKSTRVYVLSTTASSYEQYWKSAFIAENYKDIDKQDIMFVARDEYKDLILKARFSGELNHVIMIDDKASVIAKLEASEIKCLHVSALID